MLDAVFDRAHGGDIGFVAGIAGDEQITDAKAAEQQFRRHAAVHRRRRDHHPRHLAPGYGLALLQPDRRHQLPGAAG